VTTPVDAPSLLSVYQALGSGELGLQTPRGRAALGLALLALGMGGGQPLPPLGSTVTSETGAPAAHGVELVMHTEFLRKCSMLRDHDDGVRRSRA
jgi:hypothetical protein